MVPSKADRLFATSRNSLEDAIGVLGAVDDYFHAKEYSEALDHLDSVIAELMTLRSYLELLTQSL